MTGPRDNLVASRGMLSGLHPGMGVAAKGMAAAFVIFTVLNVVFAGSVYGAIRGWIESGLSWYYISTVTGPESVVDGGMSEV